jgi:hypothetical protein
MGSRRKFSGLRDQRLGAVGREGMLVSKAYGEI